jgi:hypothetical protein
MTTIKNLITEITRLTSEIESKHPELYRFLDENPITLPSAAHPEITQDVLAEYLVSLRQQLRHFLETHRKSILKT